MQPASPNPRVSVVVPFANSERTLEAALRSALGQSFADLEIIAVDDGSTDRSGEIARGLTARGLADSKLRVLRQERGGCSKARNAGIAVARGEFIAFLDSDDVWFPDKLAAQVRCLEKYPEVGACYTLFALADEFGHIVKVGEAGSSAEISALELLGANPVKSASQVMVRRRVLDEVAAGPDSSRWFDEGLLQAGDIDLWLRIAASTDWKIREVPRPSMIYRMSDSNISSDFDRHRKYRRRVEEKFAGYGPDIGIERRRSFRALFLLWSADVAARCGRGWASLRIVIEAVFSHPRIFSEHRSYLRYVAREVFWATALPDALLRRRRRRVGSRVHEQIRSSHPEIIESARQSGFS